MYFLISRFLFFSFFLSFFLSSVLLSVFFLLFFFCFSLCHSFLFYSLFLSIYLLFGPSFFFCPFCFSVFSFFFSLFSLTILYRSVFCTSFSSSFLFLVLGLGDKTITISIAIDTWSISIENMFDRTFDNFTELRQKQVICERWNTVWDPVAGWEVYARNSVYFWWKWNIISDTDTDRRTSVSLRISATGPLLMRRDTEVLQLRKCSAKRKGDLTEM